MSEPVIEVQNLSKRYHLGVISRQTLQDEVRYWWHKVRGRDPMLHMGKVALTGHGSLSAAQREGCRPDEFWALRDVSFSIGPGEVVGIVGRNGAGKSTLLKILSRITSPTEGEAVITGRTGSLLEVGTGFHPELTGRENVFMNGTILGMKKAEIARKFDEIVAFAEIEQFLDTPVKRYSKGMYVRLAFAVAAHLEPEILIVDEVLAVGDAEFQQRCIGKMKDVAQQDGRTVLFVSHNMSAIQVLCGKCMLLRDGGLVMYEDTDRVVDEYLFGSRQIDSVTTLPPAQSDAYFNRVWLSESGGHVLKAFPADQEIRVNLGFVVRRPLGAVLPFLRLTDRYGAVLFHAAPDPASARAYTPGEYEACLTVPAHFLAPGYFFVTVGLQRSGIQRLDYREQVAGFEVTNVGLQPVHMSHARVGSVLVDFPWTVGPRETPAASPG